MSAGNREIADGGAWGAFPRFFASCDGVRDPVAWVFRTAFRLAGRELKRQREVADGDVPDRAGDGEPSILPLYVVKGLPGLSPEQRSAVFLHYFADLPVVEV